MNPEKRFDANATPKLPEEVARGLKGENLDFVRRILEKHPLPKAPVESRKS